MKVKLIQFSSANAEECEKRINEELRGWDVQKIVHSDIDYDWDRRFQYKILIVGEVPDE